MVEDIYTSTVAVLVYSARNYKQAIEAGSDYASIYRTWILGDRNPFCEAIRAHIRADLGRDGSLLDEDEVEMRFWNVVKSLKSDQRQELEQSIELRRRVYLSTFMDLREVRVSNAREWPEVGLASTGFCVVGHRSAVIDVLHKEMNEWQAQEYYKELKILAKQLIQPQGFAGRVHTFCNSHVIRAEAEGKSNAEHPLCYVHNDFSGDYADAAITAFETQTEEDVDVSGFHPALESTSEMKEAGLSSDILKRSRIVVLNMWRPAATVQRMPLALCDMRSVHPEDLFLERLAPGADELKTCGALFNSVHNWGYFADVTPDELIVFTTYDSHKQPFTPVLHTAFEDPRFSANGNTPPRVSCEVRVLCIVVEDCRPSKL